MAAESSEIQGDTEKSPTATSAAEESTRTTTSITDKTPESNPIPDDRLFWPPLYQMSSIQKMHNFPQAQWDDLMRRFDDGKGLSKMSKPEQDLMQMYMFGKARDDNLDRQYAEDPWKNWDADMEDMMGDDDSDNSDSDSYHDAFGCSSKKFKAMKNSLGTDVENWRFLDGREDQKTLQPLKYDPMMDPSKDENKWHIARMTRRTRGPVSCPPVYKETLKKQERWLMHKSWIFDPEFAMNGPGHRADALLCKSVLQWMKDAILKCRSEGLLPSKSADSGGDSSGAKGGSSDKNDKSSDKNTESKEGEDGIKSTDSENKEKPSSGDSGEKASDSSAATGSEAEEKTAETNEQESKKTPEQQKLAATVKAYMKHMRFEGMVKKCRATFLKGNAWADKQTAEDRTEWKKRQEKSKEYVYTCSDDEFSRDRLDRQRTTARLTRPFPADM
jgi:hypothetical protein